MALLSKQAAKKANHALDAVASDIVANAAAYGIKAEVAQKFAFQCDLIADYIAKKAGVDLTKLASQRKQGLSGDDVFDEGTLGFNPEDIGEEVGGPEEKDPDEPYMDDHFTQQWNRELREKQQAGEVSNGEGSPEPQAPAPGVQAALQAGAKLASMCQGLNKAATRCASAKDPQVALLGQHLAAAGTGVLQFQARVLEGKESPDRVAALLVAADHVMPHLAGEVGPSAAQKLARMVNILAGVAKAPKKV